MRKSTGLILSLLLATLLLAPTAHAAAGGRCELSLECSANRVEAGTTVDYAVKYLSGEPVSAMSMRLGLADGFSVVNLTAGDALPAELSCNTVDREFIFLYLDSSATTPINAGETVCVITLRAPSVAVKIEPLTPLETDVAAVSGGDVVELAASIAPVAQLDVSVSAGALGGTQAAGSAAQNGGETDDEAQPFIMMNGVTMTPEEADDEQSPAMQQAIAAQQLPEVAQQSAAPQPSDDGDKTEAGGVEVENKDNKDSIYIYIAFAFIMVFAIAVAAVVISHHKKTTGKHPSGSKK